MDDAQWAGELAVRQRHCCQSPKLQFMLKGRSGKYGTAGPCFDRALGGFNVVETHRDVGLDAVVFQESLNLLGNHKVGVESDKGFVLHLPHFHALESRKAALRMTH